MARRRRRSDRFGHRAQSPWRMPARAWKDIAARTWTRTWQDNVGLVAAGVAFYGFLAFVPMLGIIVFLYGFFAGPETVVSNVRALTDVIPPDAAVVVGEQLLSAVKTSAQTKGFAVLVAVGLALYGGANGAGAIMTALNIAYEEKEKRGLLHFYAVAMAITAAAVVLAVASLAATSVVAAFGDLAPEASAASVLVARLLGYAVLALAAAAVAATLYRYAPSREKARWTWITPGSLFAAVSWLILTGVFGFYVTNITDYSVTYGSLGTVIVFLTWIYLSAYALMFGAELNSEIEHQSARDTTTGRPLPIGRRGAWAADHVADDDEPDRKDAPSMAEATPEAPKTDDAKERKAEDRNKRKSKKR